MDKSILEYKDETFSSIEELKEYLIDEVEYSEEEVNEFSAYELVDRYLKYNGICGYTEDILGVVCAAFKINEDD